MIFFPAWALQERKDKTWPLPARHLQSYWACITYTHEESVTVHVTKLHLIIAQQGVRINVAKTRDSSFHEQEETELSSEGYGQ